MPKVSRREFLKFMAAGGIAAVLGIAGIGSFAPKASTRRLASAQTDPHWEDGPVTTSHAVHVALLPNGRVLYVAGSGYEAASKNGPYRAGIWDPVSNLDEEIFPRLPVDLFCCGQAPLPNGNILLVGGTIKYASVAPRGAWWGLKAAYEYDYLENEFIPRPDMAHGRWYPTLVVLSDGKVQVVDGDDEFGNHNLLNEIYDPNVEDWTITFDPNTSRTYTVGDQTYGGTNNGVNPGIGLYPRMHLMPSGLVAQVGQTAGRQTWDPKTKRWRGAGSGTRRSYGTSILLPLRNAPDETGRILVCGGSPSEKVGEAIATNSTEILVPNGFGFSTIPADSMNWARRYCNPVLLPNGKVIIFGGTAQDNLRSLAVMEPEMYDVETNTWTVLTEHKVPRIYHSGALLLQDGRIWTIGTSYDTKPVGELPPFDLRTEVYKPDYFFETRPEITGSPGVGEYGGTITIQTPDANTIDKVSLLKVSTTTHHYNTDQRLIWLEIDPDTRTDSSITVTAPINSKLAPPGYYMLHVIKNDIPSVGSMIKITFPPPQPIFYNIPSSSGVNVDYVTLRGGGDTRAGVEVLSGSALIDKELKTWTVYLRKTTNTASGVVTATVRKKSNDDVTPFTEQIQASTLTTSYQPYVFTLPVPRTIQANDRILIEYSGTNAIRIDVWNIDKFDTSKTRRVKFGSALTYSASNTKDASGIMSSE